VAPAGWQVQTADAATGRVMATRTCWSCTSLRVAGLTLGNRYRFLVAPLAATAPGVGLVSGQAVSSNVITVGPDGPPSAPAAVAVSVSPNDQNLQVTWAAASTGQAADSMLIYVWEMSPTFAYAGEMTAAAGQGATTIQVTPASYAVTMYAQNSAGHSSSWTISNTVAVTNSCPSADVCVSVGATTTGLETLPAQGFDAGNNTNNLQLVDPKVAAGLHTKQWRIGSQWEAGFAAVKPTSQTQLISNFWWTATQSTNGGYAVAPWANWQTYASFVTGVVNSAKSGNWAPAYWDLFNEPDGLTASGSTYLSPAARAGATPANVLQLMLVTYQAVKAADPLAKVVGPSLTAYHDTPGEFAEPIDMASFLAFAAANHMVLDAISWHEISPYASSGDWFMGATPAHVVDHVARAKHLLAQYPAVGNPAIFVNEFGPPAAHLLPGWFVGFAASFDATGVAQANRTCWSECLQPSLDGLLTAAVAGGPIVSTEGGPLPAPTSSYWTAAAYASMDGGARLPLTSTASSRLTGLATRADATQTITALLGNDWGCQPAVDSSCPASGQTPNLSVAVNLAWPYSTTQATVTVTGYLPVPGVVAQPRAVTMTVPVVNGSVSINLSAVAAGEAVQVRVTGA
jgi:hypothetical protein